MEDDGWVHVTPVVQHGRPDKKVYTVADAGRAELARWIAEPLRRAGSGRGGSVADNRTRDLAVKIRAAAYGDVDALRDPGRRAARRTRRIAGHLPRIREAPVPGSPRACAAAHCTSTWCCAAASAPRKVPSTGSTKCAGGAVTLPEPVVAVGPWLHHPAQPGGDGLDAHRPGGPGPRHRPARRVFRRTGPRRRRPDHHRRLCPQQTGWLLPFASQMVSSSDARRHRRITSAVHDAGGKILLQILHAGRYAYHPFSVSASSVKAPINPFRPRKLSSRGVDSTIDDFVRCALLAREAGYDGVEIMGSEGYLLNQFLAPRTNKRTDAWGGTPQKRRRFPVEIVRRTRAAVGTRFHHLLPDVDGRLRRGRPELGRNRRAGNRSRGGRSDHHQHRLRLARGAGAHHRHVGAQQRVRRHQQRGSRTRQHPGGGLQPDQHAAGRRADPRRRPQCS